MNLSDKTPDIPTTEGLNLDPSLDFGMTTVYNRLEPETKEWTLPVLMLDEGSWDNSDLTRSHHGPNNI